MTTIKAKNGEWVNLSNHLPTVTKVEGKAFAIAVAKNIEVLKNSLQHLEGVLSPTPEFAELSEKVKAYQDKKDKKSIAAIKNAEDGTGTFDDLEKTKMWHNSLYGDLCDICINEKIKKLGQ